MAQVQIPKQASVKIRAVKNISSQYADQNATKPIPEKVKKASPELQEFN
jgi:hypothetical protein